MGTRRLIISPGAYSSICLVCLAASFLTRNCLETLLPREKELNELMSTKAGVKGLLDSGISNVPRCFKLPAETMHIERPIGNHVQVPVIDLQGYEGEKRKTIVNEVLQASRTWGIFQVVNHGVPLAVTKSMLSCVKEFHEQPKQLKEEFYSHDSTRKVWYYMTVKLLLRCAFWKDTIACQLEDMSTDFEALPLICRKPMSNYVKHIIKLKGRLSKLLSEALELDSDHLERIGCMEARKLVGHYYPACPEPELTLGTPKHSDPYFFTILLQDEIECLQVLHENQWVYVQPVEGALIAMIGDMLQIISNDIFVSAEHRVLTTKTGPRLSAACFFYPNIKNKDQKFRPIEELLCDNDPALYKEISHSDYLKDFNVHDNCCSNSLPHLRL